MKHILSSVFFSVLISSSMMSTASNMGCTNTNDGNPKNEGSSIVCNIEETFDDDGTMPKSTFGLVKYINANIILRISTDLDQLSTIFNQGGIQIPAQELSVKVGFTNGQILPAKIVLAPYLSIVPNVSFGCSFRFNNINPGLTIFESSYLPDWVRNGVLNLVNNNLKLKAKATDYANNLLRSALAKTLSCSN